jgi:hypothetical protein
MAYYIFLKSLRSLEEFRKISISKFLLNLLVQISKGLVYSKIKILFRKEFSYKFWPNRPSHPLTCSSFWRTQPTRPFFLPHHAGRAPPPAPLRPLHHGCRPLHLPRHGAPTVAPNNSPPFQSAVVTTPFTPGNGSHEGANYHHRPPFTAAPASVPTL